jgi:hypothetical protein
MYLYILMEEVQHVMNCSDDVINVSGHRLSCGAMEEVYISTCTVFSWTNKHTYIYIYIHMI